MRMFLKIIFNRKIYFLIMTLIIAIIFTNFFDSRLLTRISLVDSLFIVAILLLLGLIRIKVFYASINRSKEISEIRITLHQKLKNNAKKLNDFSIKYKQIIINDEIKKSYLKFKKQKLKNKISYDEFKDFVLTNELDQLKKYVKKGKLKTKKYELKPYLYEKSDLTFKQRILSGDYSKIPSYVDSIHLVTIYGFIASLNLFNDILVNIELNPSAILFFYVFALVIFIVEACFSFQREKKASLAF